MSAEYLKAKEENWDRLASDTSLNLRRIQEGGLQGKFSFTDHWKRTKQDKLTHPQVPVLNQVSRMFLNFHVETWVEYSYKDRELSADIYQRIGGIQMPESVRLVGHHDAVDVTDIPFDKFSETDLLNAAKTVESQLHPVQV